MQPAQDALHRTRPIVLHEGHTLPERLVKVFLIPAFEKKSPFIAEDSRVDKENTRQIGRLELHEAIL